MSKQYINGYDSPSFIIFHSDSDIERIDLSFKYTALSEYEEEVSTLDEFTDGSKENTVHYYNYEWQLLYDDEITLMERFKIKKIQDALKLKKKVLLIPHRDFPWRKFRIIILPEKRVIELDSHFNGYENTTNYGYEIKFANKEPILYVSISDPNYLPITAAESCQEF